MKQLERRDNDLEAAEIQPIEMGMPLMKEISAKWLVDMAEYLSDNPQIIVNGFDVSILVLTSSAIAMLHVARKIEIFTCNYNYVYVIVRM